MKRMIGVAAVAPISMPRTSKFLVAVMQDDGLPRREQEGAPATICAVTKARRRLSLPIRTVRKTMTA
jgi:hypothetical protein